MRKGQAELIIIVGVIIVGVIVILYASRESLQSPFVSQEEKAVRNSLENLIRSAADQSLQTLSVNGGYSSVQGDGVSFLNKQVPLWQKEGALSIPPVKSAFPQLVESFIDENKQSFISGLSTEVTVGDPSVSASFFDNKITLTVNLPTTLNGKSISGRYDVDILTNFGEIVRFAEDYSKAQSRDRFLEYFVLSSLVISPLENGEHTTPLIIVLTRCGDTVFKNWEEVREQAQDRVAVTLAHTYLPGKAPTHVGEVTPFPKYVIPPIEGEQYSNIEVSFHLPDEFELDASSFQFTPDPIIAVSSPIGFTGACASTPLYVQYYFNFPVIVRVKDPLTQNIFQFAQQVFIKNNRPGEWTDSALYDQDVQASICADMQCNANILLKSGDGHPISDAEISFMGCSLGQTDGAGKIQTTAPCGIGPLKIIKPGYEPLLEQNSHAGIENRQIVIPKMLKTKVNLYEVNLVDFASVYTADKIELLPEKRRVLFTMRSSTDKAYIRQFDSAAGVLENIPAGTYSVIASLTDENLQQIYGQVQLIHIFNESTEEINVYIPYNAQFAQLNTLTDAQIAAEKGFAFTSVLEKCGIGPLAAIPVEGSKVLPCSKGYGEV